MSPVWISSDEVLISHMQQAKALALLPKKIWAHPPLSCGTPVIALRGALETVRGMDNENPTAFFFPNNPQRLYARRETFEVNCRYSP